MRSSTLELLFVKRSQLRWLRTPPLRGVPGRPRGGTCWRDEISRPAWEHLRGASVRCQKVLEHPAKPAARVSGGKWMDPRMDGETLLEVSTDASAIRTLRLQPPSCGGTQRGAPGGRFLPAQTGEKIKERKSYGLLYRKKSNNLVLKMSA